MNHARGFTIMELVTVMAVMSILAVSATSCFQRTGFDSAGYANEVRAQLAYAQKIAVAARRSVTVDVGGNAVALAICTDAACSGNTPVIGPKGTAYVRSAPKDVSIGPNASFSFDAQGAPSTGATFTVSGGGTNRTITVEAGTGYVH